MSGLTSVIPFEQISKIDLYINNAKKTMDTIKRETGCDYIINAGLFNLNTFAPMGILVKDGKRLTNGKDQYGYAFKDGKAVYSYDNNVNWPDFVSAYPVLLANGKQAFTSAPAGLDGNRGRSAVGITKDSLILRCVSDSGTGKLTLTQLANDMIYLGCDTAINLDGGGSSQCDFAGQKITSSRLVQNFICVWVKKESEADRMMTNLPLIGRFSVTAAYGETGPSWSGGHKGIDFISNIGSEAIYCTCDGTVRVVAFDANGWGQYVSIGDALGRRHLFCHLVQGSVKVKKGDKVTRNTVIGTMGMSGNSTGKHLHYQINNASDVPIDPTAWLHIPNKRGTYDSADYQVDANGNLINKPEPPEPPSGKVITVAELKAQGYTTITL